MSSDTPALYGYCPTCGGLGRSRERRPNGDDRCENGHQYPSSKAVKNSLSAVSVTVSEDAATLERAAIVAYLRRRANAEHPVECGVPSLSPAGRGLLLLVADRIESGEHLNGEG